MALQSSAILEMNEFLGKSFLVPNYQREYSWEQDELDDFWSDLVSTVNDSDNGIHFFGQIVIHDDESAGNKYIIDGQQRTITSTILMRVMQVLFEELYIKSGNTLKKANYKQADISSIHIGREDSLHLTLGELDKEFFENNIQLGKPDPEEEYNRLSHERIRKAYYYFDGKLREELEKKNNIEDKYDRLFEFYDTFVKRFKVLYMEATKLDEAFIIFETLNARGKELETSDLLKNYLFSHSNASEIRDRQSKWESMMSDLDKVDPTKYIRHFWNSRSEFTREKALYRVISNKITTNADCKKFMKSIEENAMCYHDMVCPEEISEFTDDGITRSLGALKTLNASSFYPIVLAMKQKSYSEEDIASVLYEIESYVFRNATICGKTANTSEVFFADVALKIYKGDYVNTDAICQEIKSKMVSDQEFSDAFKIWRGKSRGKETIRYIFRRIHTHLDEGSELSIESSTVHIEHIMPVDNTKWQVEKEEHDEYLWRLGNLCLLSGKFNKQISNKVFADKKCRYGDSKIEPNKKLIEYDEWNKENIESRQSDLADIALEIWKK